MTEDKDENLPAIIPEDAPESSIIATLQDNFNPLTGFNMNLSEKLDFEENTELIIISKDGGKFSVCAEKFKFIKKKGTKVILQKVTDKDEKQKELIAEFIGCSITILIY